MATFESMDRRMPKIEACLKANGLESLDACNEMLLAKGIDCDKIVRGVQPICFDNAVWAYTLGTAIAVKRGLTDAAECAAAIGEGLEAFTIPGSVAEQRQVGLGHGNLGARLLSEDTTCFAFLAGHESFAAAEGAIGIARTANKVRKTPLRVILNGLGKDAAYIISRINGFTYVQTEYDIPTQTLKVVKEIPFSEGERAAVKCYGANDVMEGVAIMKKEDVQCYGAYDYIGYLDFPGYGLTMPVAATWSFPALEISPCRHTGSVYNDNLVVAGHNYNTHFGVLFELQLGDIVTFTDVDGNAFTYTVRELTSVSPDDSDAVMNRGYALTLYTCNWDTTERVTVFCERTNGEV